MVETSEGILVSRRRVKNARISVGFDMKVKVVIPLWYTDKHLQLLLLEKQKWIQKQLAHFTKAKGEMITLAPGQILYLGQAYKPGFEVSNHNLLRRWYLDRASELFSERINVLAATHGFVFSKLTLRNQKTRWGSCSKRKNISLNIKLIKTPLYVIDYVILHELAHTQYFDHSKSFWQKVAQVCPEYKQALAWLKQHGKYL